MRRIRHEAALSSQRMLDLLVARLDMPEHVVEGCAQPAQLVVRTVVLNATREVARVADVFGCLGNASDRSERLAGKHPASAKGHDDAPEPCEDQYLAQEA